jgi:phenylalanyl-tRNA synthetase beta chain
MKVLYNWLKEFVDVTLAPRELAERLSLAGVAVDSVEDSPAGPVFDAEITTNRPDLMGHLGVAREVAAILRSSLRAAVPAVKESADRTDAAVRVEIACPELCGRYAARVVRGVKIQPSPDWLRRRLEALGQTSINNVVDVSNYVMFETGKPVHAFDLDTIDGRRIVVRRANPGEKLRTLDGVERALTKEMCMIADARRSVGLGGIMGGAETEIGSLTRNVLIESAWFNPIAIRRTAKALGLRTEASIRFERRADAEMVVPAATRTAELIQQLAGGEILAGVVDICPMRQEEHALELSRREILRVMGADVPDAEIEAILRALGFAPTRVDGNRGSRDSLMAAWKCRQPSWRADVTREIDLVEEVARHYGFDKFPARLPPAKQPATRLPHATAEDRLRERLVALGYQEIVAIPLVDEAHDAVFRASGVAPARISNPLAEDASLLRTSGIVNMLHTLEWNLNRGQKNLRLFEIGRAYALDADAAKETPIVTLGVTGQAREKNLYEAPRAFGFEDLLGDLEVLAEDFGGLKPLPGTAAWLHPARSARIMLPDGSAGDKAVGVAGQLARRVAEQFKLKHAVFVAEMELALLYRAHTAQLAARRYRPLSRFPAVERDFSLLLDDRVTFAMVREVIAALRIAEAERIEAVDLFRGGSVPAGKHSLLVRVTLQSYEATLTDAQVIEISARIVSALETKLGAVLRTA